MIFGKSKIDPGVDAFDKSMLRHFVLGVSLDPPYPLDSKTIRFGMGCFWGVERLFWKPDGVYVTAVGYAGGEGDKPNYNQVCSGTTGHAEVAQVVYNESRVPLDHLLKIFWENHDPTQSMRQGNDVGSQYRSIILCDDQEALALCLASKEKYQAKLTDSGFGQIATEIKLDPSFHLAEENHQQYLAKNPSGYCNHGFCQVAYE